MNPIWYLLLLPLASVTLITLVTRCCGRFSAALSTAVAGVGTILGVLVWRGDLTAPQSITWLSVGSLEVTFGMTIDPLSKMMLLVVTGVGFLIHFYSLAYMKNDEGKARYFACLSLFMFSMIGIVVATNFVMMFIFWELVGVSSYLLIGHWFGRPAAAEASKKAFITNKIGDFGFMIGILMLWGIFKTVSFSELDELVNAPLNGNWLDVIVLFLFCGTVGKSAMFPLHVWLPDAMEGPTPVSALIHAATMVAAGVYMLCRIYFLLDLAPLAMSVIAWIGGGTALMAALIAIQQNDIKRILAYSTLSQLGYMVMAVGLTAPTPAMYHLTTHAFFKALLFLGAGSVIHALHHEQDIWKMGGLHRRMPWTFYTFLIGTLALTGCPGLSGFFSKDEILVAARHGDPFLFVIGLATAFLTAFYMARLFTVAFVNPPHHHDGHDHPAPHESPWIMVLPLVILAVPSILAGYLHLPEKIGIALVEGAHHDTMVMALSGAVFLAGILTGFILYRGRQKDPISIRLLQNKFYFDEVYGFFIRYVQQGFALMTAWFDRLVLDTFMVTGTGMAANIAGRILSWFQTGSVQAYAVWLGLGIVIMLYALVSGVEATQCILNLIKPLKSL